MATVPWFGSGYFMYAYKTPPWGQNFTLETDHGTIIGADRAKYFGVVMDQELTWKLHSIRLQGKL